MERRLFQMNMALSPSERELIYINAGRAGMRPQEFIRYVATQPYPTQQNQAQSH